MIVRVRATEVGFFGDRLWAVGDEFDIQKKEQFSDRWMEKVEKPEAKTEPEVETEDKEGA